MSKHGSKGRKSTRVRRSTASPQRKSKTERETPRGRGAASRRKSSARGLRRDDADGRKEVRGASRLGTAQNRGGAHRLRTSATGSKGGRVDYGRMTVHPKGFGFVRVESGSEDVFVPPPAMGGALHGDRVCLEVAKSHKGFEGRVQRIEERWLKRLTGTLRRTREGYVLEPDFLRIRGPLEVIGDLPDGIFAGDDHGGHGRQRSMDLRATVVVAEIVSYPENGDEQPIVRVLRSLGARGRADVEVEKIKIQEGVEEQFPAAVRAAAEAIPTRLRKVDKEGREDLRHLDLVTIDPPDARDHDDALFIEKTSRDSYRVVIAIADVSHYVQEGSALDAEALQRGCSIYLPDRSIPMLPEELSSHMASLVPNKDRLCMAVEVELSRRGKVLSSRIFEAYMRSKAKISYGGAARALGMSDKPRKERAAEARVPMLTLLAELSAVLRKKRMNQGRLDFELPEPKVRLNEATREPEDVQRAKGNVGIRDAYRLVEEMMLLANEVVARAMVKHKHPAIYRVHSHPQEEKLAAFLALATSLGETLSFDDAKTPRNLARAVRKLADSPRAAVLHYLLLRSLPQAIYSTENGGHFGLGTKDYLHFTSPIRRYPDLQVHRQLRAMLRGKKAGKPTKKNHRAAASGDAGSAPGLSLLETLARAAVEASRLERRAMTVERQVIDVYRVLLMKDRLGEEFEGAISGVENFGVYVSLDDPFVDVLVPMERLGREAFQTDEYGIRLEGVRSGVSYTLGDRIKVRLDEANLSERRLIASPAWMVAPRAEDLPLPMSAQELRGRERRRRRSRRSEADHGASMAPSTDAGDHNAGDSGVEDRGARKDGAAVGDGARRTRPGRAVPKGKRGARRASADKGRQAQTRAKKSRRRRS